MTTYLTLGFKKFQYLRTEANAFIVRYFNINRGLCSKMFKLLYSLYPFCIQLRHLRERAHNSTIQITGLL